MTAESLPSSTCTRDGRCCSSLTSRVEDASRSEQSEGTRVNTVGLTHSAPCQGCMQAFFFPAQMQARLSRERKPYTTAHGITSALSADAAVIQPAGAPWQQRRRGGRVMEGDNSEEMRGSPPWLSCFPICVHSYTLSHTNTHNHTHTHTHTHTHKAFCRVQQLQ